MTENISEPAQQFGITEEHGGLTQEKTLALSGNREINIKVSTLPRSIPKLAKPLCMSSFDRCPDHFCLTGAEFTLLPTVGQGTVQLLQLINRGDPCGNSKVVLENDNYLLSW